MIPKAFFDQLRERVASGDFEEAFSALTVKVKQELTVNGHNVSLKTAYNDILHQCGLFNQLKRERQKGIVDNSALEVRRAKIVDGLLGLIDDVEGVRPADDEALSTDEEKTIEIEITIDRKFSEFKEAEQEKFMKAIAQLLDMEESRIQIVRKREGSVKLTIRIPESKEEEFLKLVQSGELNYLNVVGVDHNVVYKNPTNREITRKIVTTIDIDFLRDLVLENTTNISPQLAAVYDQMVEDMKMLLDAIRNKEFRASLQPEKKFMMRGGSYYEQYQARLALREVPSLVTYRSKEYNLREITAEYLYEIKRLEEELENN